MKKVFSLNGLDRSGKTTQFNSLKANNVLVYSGKSIFDYSCMPKLKGEPLFNWWFMEGDTFDVVRSIYSAVSHRNKDISSANYPLIVVNRGDRMFDAVCSATIAVREGVSIEEASRLTTMVKSSLDFNSLSEDQSIFYKTGDSSTEMLTLSQSRSPISTFSKKADEIYGRYQSILADILNRQLKAGLYSKVINSREGIDIVAKRTHETVMGEMTKDLNLSRLGRVMGLGGLSECGKSSIGKYMADILGFNRIKIGQVIEGVSAKYADALSERKLNVYDLGEEMLAVLFVEKLADLGSTIDSGIVLESLHNYKFTKKVKDILGNGFRIVYVDAPLDMRISRNASDVGSMQISIKEIERKDSKKISRGADLIRNIADDVLDNSRSIADTHRQLEAILAKW